VAARRGATPGSATPAGGQGGSSTPTSPAALNPTGAAPKPVKNVRTPSTGGGTRTPTTPTLPQVQLPELDSVAGTQAGAPVQQVADGVTQTVNQTTDAAGDAVNGVTGGLLP